MDYWSNAYELTILLLEIYDRGTELRCCREIVTTSRNSSASDTFMIAMKYCHVVRFIFDPMLFRL